MAKHSYDLARLQEKIDAIRKDLDEALNSERALKLYAAGQWAQLTGYYEANLSVVQQKAREAKVALMRLTEELDGNGES